MFLLAARQLAPLLPSSPLVRLQLTRTYLKNFYDPGTAIKPPAGWMHKNRRHFEHSNKDGRIIKLPIPKETKRIRKFGWDAMMMTEGRRRMVMDRILKKEDVLTH